jgi:hypothetical protein
MRSIALTSQSLDASPRRRLSARRVAPAVLLSLALGVAAPASGAEPGAADPGVVRTWNSIAVETLVQAPPNGAGRTAPEAFLYFAFVQAAVYNAVVGITGEYELYRWNVRAPKGASPEAAAAAAAHRVLRTYFGGNSTIAANLDNQLAASLGNVPEGVAKTQGIRYGERAADRLIELRTNDGRDASVTVPPASEPGDWRPTPPANAPFLVPWYAGIDTLLVDSTSQFDPGPPPAIGTETYRTEFAEVRDFGAVDSVVRTADQTLSARFFSDIGIRPLQASLRDLTVRRDLDISDTARHLAVVDMSMADATANAWYAKLKYMWWRPITAIREADTDGDPQTAGVPGWTPLLVTPPYPDWPSGLCSFVGAVTTALSRLNPDGTVDLILISPSAGTRHYVDAATMQADAVSARVWSGIHFRTADQVSITIGTQVANFALDHYFAPMK